MVNLAQILAIVAFPFGAIAYAAYLAYSYTVSLISALISSIVPLGWISIVVMVVIFLLWLVPGLSHIPSIVIGAVLHFTSIMLTLLAVFFNLAVAAAAELLTGFWNNVCEGANLLIDTFLENLCPNQDFSQCIGLEAFGVSIGNIIANLTIVINMLFDLFTLIAGIGNAVYAAARQSNLLFKFGIGAWAAVIAFRDSVSGNAFASFARQPSYFDTFTSLQTQDVRYMNESFAHWKLFTTDAPICPDMLCRNPAQDGMMYFSMLNASHANTITLENGLRVPMFTADNSFASALDALTTEELKVFAVQAAAAFNALLVNVLPVATQILYFGMDLFKLLAIMFIIILIPFLKPLAMLLLLFYYVFGQPTAGGGGITYVPSADTMQFLRDNVDNVIQNYIAKYSLQARVYLLNRADVPGPTDLKLFLLGVIEVLEYIISLPAQIALLVVQYVDKILCTLFHLFPCLHLGEVCDAFFARGTGFLDWVFWLARWVQDIVLAGCHAITAGECNCAKCKPDPDSVLYYVTIPGDGYPCVPNHSISGMSCCISDSIVHWIPVDGYAIFGIQRNTTIPKDVFFALERQDLNMLMQFSSMI